MDVEILRQWGKRSITRAPLSPFMIYVAFANLQMQPTIQLLFLDTQDFQFCNKPPGHCAAHPCFESGLGRLKACRSYFLSPRTLNQCLMQKHKPTHLELKNCEARNLAASFVLVPELNRTRSTQSSTLGHHPKFSCVQQWGFLGHRRSHFVVAIVNQLVVKNAC